MSTLTVEELRSKSTQAAELIEKLKNQIAQIKIASSPAKMAERSTSLQQENEKLKKQVEELKKQLEAAEGKSPKAAPLGNVSNVPKSEASTATPEKKAEKKPKQQQENKKQTPKKEELKPEDINISKLDIRIGKIMKVERHPDADGLYVEQVDLGEGKLRQVCSGLVKHIPIEEMENILICVLCNLKPCKLRGVASEAMVLCASSPEKVELMIAPPGAQIGDRLTCEGFTGEPVEQCTPKNKVFDMVAVDLKTDDNLVGCYKGTPLEIKGKGPIKSKTLKGVMVK